MKYFVFFLLFISFSLQANYKCDQIIQKTGFDICYNYQLKSPLWAKTLLTRHKLNKDRFDRKNFSFYEETSVPRKYRSTLASFRRSGYDRGHTISAADVSFDRRSLKDSFSLANVSAQTPEANRGLYRLTEILTRKLAKKAGKATVIAGAVFDRIRPKRIGAGGVAVPSHLYRIVYWPGGAKYAFLIPNVKKTWEKNHPNIELLLKKLIN